jgi:DNA modification methylase
MLLSVMPAALIVDAMLDCSKRGDIVLDGFAGCGTTLIAAEHGGRRGYVMEINPKCVDTAIRRWQAHSRGQAIHTLTGGNIAEPAEMCADAGENGPAVPEPLGTAW